MSASRRTSLLLLVVVFSALSSTACIEPQTLGTLRGVVTATSMLQDDRIIELATRSATYVKSWAAAATIVGLFWLYFRLRAGDHDALNSFVLHTTLAYALLVPTLSDALYWPRASVTVGRRLAELYPVTDWLSYSQPGTAIGMGRFAHVGWQGVAALRMRVAEGGDRRDGNRNGGSRGLGGGSPPLNSGARIHFGRRVSKPRRSPSTLALPGARSSSCLPPPART